MKVFGQVDLRTPQRGKPSIDPLVDVKEGDHWNVEAWPSMSPVAFDRVSESIANFLLIGETPHL